MRHNGWNLKATVVLAMVLPLGLAARAAEPRGWMTDVRTAETESRRLNRPLLLHFYADWCGPCKKMDGETLHAPAVLQQLNGRFVGVKVNSDLHRELREQFNVESLPSDVIVSPDGRVLAHTTGYQGQRDYLSRLARVDAIFTQAQKTRLAADPAGPRIPDGIRPVEDPPDTRSPGESKFVGLSGYSPVALFKRRDWVKGKKEFAASHEEVLYYFASREEREEFAANPRQFAPRMLGCDPVVLAETERAIPGSTRFGAYFEGELYLFVGSETRDQFRKEPERYAQARTAIPVDQVEYRRAP